MENNFENNFIDKKEVISNEAEAKNKISKEIKSMFLGLENEGGNKEIRKHKEKILGIERNPQYPNLDKQDDNWEDDENPDKLNLEEEEDKEDGI